MYWQRYDRDFPKQSHMPGFHVAGHIWRQSHMWTNWGTQCQQYWTHCSETYGCGAWRGTFMLLAEPLPGILHTLADEDSRVMKAQSNQMLNHNIFQWNQRIMGPLAVDLLPQHWKLNFPGFFSWRPDLAAETLNALAPDWGNMQGMDSTNLPWAVISRALTQVHKQ